MASFSMTTANDEYWRIKRLILARFVPVSVMIERFCINSFNNILLKHFENVGKTGTEAKFSIFFKHLAAY